MLELTVQENTKSSQSVSTWWVDPFTYLPVQELIENAAGTYRYDYGFLPPTPANIAQLKVTIPAGFTRTPTQKLP